MNEQTYETNICPSPLPCEVLITNDLESFFHLFNAGDVEKDFAPSLSMSLDG